MHRGDLDSRKLGFKDKLNCLVRKTLIRLNYQNQIFLLGDGRSGTTWLGDIINFDGSYLDVFEPYHGREYLSLSDGRMYPVPSDLEQPPGLDMLGSQGSWRAVERPRRLTKGRCIIKDVSSHHILDFLPEVRRRKFLLILRHPFSVALSKEKYGDWHSESDIEMLKKSDSRMDGAVEACMSESLVKSRFLEYIFIWCLLHYPLFRRAAYRRIKVVFYEELLRHPEKIICNMYEDLGNGKKFECNKDQILKVSGQVSRTSISNNQIDANRFYECPWHGKKSESEFGLGHQILKAFCMDKIYCGSSLMPRVQADRIYDLF